MTATTATTMMRDRRFVRRMLPWLMNRPFPLGCHGPLVRDRGTTIAAPATAAATNRVKAPVPGYAAG